MTRTAILLAALAVVAPPAAIFGLHHKPIASTWWWSPERLSVEDLETYGSRIGCWPEYTAWYNKHHCYSDIDTGQTKCRD